MNYISIPAPIITSEDLDIYEKMMYVVLAQAIKMNEKLSVEELAKRAGMGKTKGFEALSVLECFGIIERIEVKEAGRKMKNEYIIKSN